MLKEELPLIECKVMSNFSNVRRNTVKWRENPVSNIMGNLWGCSEICVFCNEPCMNSNKSHWEDKFPHKCLQHRPNGIAGFRDINTRKLVVEFCNHLVATKETYTKRSQNKSGRYKDYKEHYPDWDIPPNFDVSKYWMWVMCKYRIQLAEMYDSKDPNIPSNWESISKNDALNSL